jgi:polyphosphate glucokinase
MAVNKREKNKTPSTLSIDIGGTGIKMMVVDPRGRPLTGYIRELTPHPATMIAVCHLLSQMIQRLNVKFDRVSAGFPGVIKNGVITTAVNMHPSWIGINFQKKLQHMTDHPARVANDADIQGMAM